jgi:hypothetical protein
VDSQSQSLEASTPEQADTAVFYSISSTRKGLAGVDLGKFLIKQVAQRVLAEFPNVQMLITLSPIPGFRDWLHTQVDAELKRLEQGGQQVGSQHCPCMTKHCSTQPACKQHLPGGIGLLLLIQHCHVFHDIGTLISWSDGWMFLPLLCRGTSSNTPKHVRHTMHTSALLLWKHSRHHSCSL